MSCDFTTCHNLSTFLDTFGKIWPRSPSTADWGEGQGHRTPRLDFWVWKPRVVPMSFFPVAEAVRGNVWKTGKGEAAGLKGGEGEGE